MLDKTPGCRKKLGVWSLFLPLKKTSDVILNSVTAQFQENNWKGRVSSYVETEAVQ